MTRAVGCGLLELMQPNARTTTSSTTTLSRLAGLCGIAFVLTTLLDLSGALGTDLYFSDAPAAEILAWIGQNARQISLSIFLNSVETTLLYGGLIVLLLHVAHTRSALGVLAYLGLAISIVTTWTQAGMVYAMVDLNARGGADAGVLALFTLGKTMQFTDSLGVALAIGGASLVSLRARVLPAWLGWFGVAVATFHLVEDPLRIMVGLRAVGPIGIVLGLTWVLAVGIALEARPVSEERASDLAAAAA